MRCDSPDKHIKGDAIHIGEEAEPERTPERVLDDLVGTLLEVGDLALAQESELTGGRVDGNFELAQVDLKVRR